MIVSIPLLSLQRPIQLNGSCIAVDVSLKAIGKRVFEVNKLYYHAFLFLDNLDSFHALSIVAIRSVMMHYICHWAAMFVYHSKRIQYSLRFINSFIRSSFHSRGMKFIQLYIYLYLPAVYDHVQTDNWKRAHCISDLTLLANQWSTIKCGYPKPNINRYV